VRELAKAWNIAELPEGVIEVGMLHGKAPISKGSDLYTQFAKYMSYKYAPNLLGGGYKRPVKIATKSYYNGGLCIDCGRPRSVSAGRKCKECSHKDAIARYEEKFVVDSVLIRIINRRSLSHEA
jgi:hypothetical protein